MGKLTGAFFSMLGMVAFFVACGAEESAPEVAELVSSEEAALAPCDTRPNQVADFNDDGRADIFFHQTNGANALWMMNGGTVVDGSYLPTIDPAFHVVGLGDFDGDDRADIVLQSSDGAGMIRLMGGAEGIADVSLPSTAFAFTAVGDFDGDGTSDLFLEHADGTAAIWLIEDGSVVGGNYVSLPGPTWTVEGVGFFNAGARSDLVARDDTGAVEIWTMSMFGIETRSSIATLPSSWTVAGTGDFDGNGRTDILLYEDDDGPGAIWFITTANPEQVPQLAAGNLLADAGPDWAFAGVGDFNGDGRSDILLHRADGASRIWQMNGGGIDVVYDLPAVDAAWYACMECLVPDDCDSGSCVDGQCAPFEPDGGGLVFTCEDLPINSTNTCAAPLALPGPVSLRGTASMREPEPGVECPAGWYSMSRAVYSVDVPAGQTVVARSTSYGLGLVNPELLISETCGSSLYACEDGTNVGAMVVRDVRWKNNAATTNDVLVTVANPIAPGFVLDVTFGQDPVGGACPTTHCLDGGVCLPKDSSREHCGECGNVCAIDRTCEAGQCVVLQSCPPPRVTMPDGACGLPSATAAFCGCGAACSTGQACVDGSCVSAAAGETCQNPLNVVAGSVPGPGVWAQTTASSSDEGVKSVPQLATPVHAPDATFLVDRSVAACDVFTVYACTEGTCTSQPRKGWIYVEMFDAASCAGAPLATWTIAPNAGPQESPSSIQIPAVAPTTIRLRLRYLAVDEQGPVTFQLGYSPYSC